MLPLRCITPSFNYFLLVIKYHNPLSSLPDVNDWPSTCRRRPKLANTAADNPWRMLRWDGNFFLASFLHDGYFRWANCRYLPLQRVRERRARFIFESTMNVCRPPKSQRGKLPQSPAIKGVSCSANVGTNDGSAINLDRPRIKHNLVKVDHPITRLRHGRWPFLYHLFRCKRRFTIHGTPLCYIPMYHVRLDILEAYNQIVLR